MAWAILPDFSLDDGAELLDRDFCLDHLLCRDHPGQLGDEPQSRCGVAGTRVRADGAAIGKGHRLVHAPRRAGTGGAGDLFRAELAVLVVLFLFRKRCSVVNANIPSLTVGVRFCQ